MLPGIIGTFQATEAIKLLTGIGEPMIGKLLHYDALSSRFKSFNITQDPKCRLCGENPSINEPMEIKGHCNNENSLPEIEIKELEKIISASKNYNLLDVRTDNEFNEYRINPSIWIPLDELDGRISELSASEPLYVICKSGVRSSRAVSILHSKGLNNATNVSGGIDAWKKEIDTTQPNS